MLLLMLLPDDADDYETGRDLGVTCRESDKVQRSIFTIFCQPIILIRWIDVGRIKIKISLYRADGVDGPPEIERN